MNNKSTFESVIREHLVQKAIEDEQQLKADYANLPDDFKAMMQRFKEKSQSERQSNNVIQGNFGKKTFYVPKSQAGAGKVEETWYERNTISLAEGLQLELDIDGDDLELTLHVESDASFPESFSALMDEVGDAPIKLTLVDNGVVLAELEGAMINHRLVAAGTVIQHEKVSDGDDQLELILS